MTPGAHEARRSAGLYSHLASHLCSGACVTSTSSARVPLPLGAAEETGCHRALSVRAQSNVRWRLGNYIGLEHDCRFAAYGRIRNCNRHCIPSASHLVRGANSRATVWTGMEAVSAECESLVARIAIYQEATVKWRLRRQIALGLLGRLGRCLRYRPELYDRTESVDKHCFQI
jgi:hypothetical protein